VKVIVRSIDKEAAEEVLNRFREEAGPMGEELI
jgi:hypothetical protein